jgi:nucleoside-diphosphate-sugar epimerase
VKVLVTGASGFLGSHIAEQFAGEGHEVRLLLRKTSNRKFLEFPYEPAIGDVTDPGSLVAAVSGVDVVVHAAALVKARNEAEFVAVNSQGAANLVAAVEAHNPGLRRFVHISSIGALGPSTDGKPPPADAPPRPITAYGRSKLAGEMAVCNSSLGPRTVVFRPPAIYGPRDPALLPFFQLARFRFAPLLAGGYNRTSMVYGPDCAKAAVLAATSEADIGGRIYYPEDGRPCNWREMLDAIQAAAGHRMLLVPLPRFGFDAGAIVSELFGRVTNRAMMFNREKVQEMAVNAWLCSAEELRHDMGWAPLVQVPEGARLTYEWYKSVGWL